MRCVGMTAKDKFIRQAVDSCINRGEKEDQKSFIARKYRARKVLAGAVQDRAWSCGRPICKKAKHLLAKYDSLVIDR